MAYVSPCMYAALRDGGLRERFGRVKCGVARGGRRSWHGPALALGCILRSPADELLGVRASPIVVPARFELIPLATRFSFRRHGVSFAHAGVRAFGRFALCNQEEGHVQSLCVASLRFVLDIHSRGANERD